MTTLKQRIADTKQEALDLLKKHLGQEGYFGFGSYIAKEIGISSGMLTYVNQRKRPMSYENAVLIIDAWKGIAESIENPTPPKPKKKKPKKRKTPKKSK